MRILHSAGVALEAVKVFSIVPFLIKEGLGEVLYLIKI